MSMFKTATAIALVTGLSCGMAATASAATSAAKGDNMKAWKDADAMCAVAISATAEGDAAKRFERLDTDGNGKLSKQEFLDCYAAEVGNSTGVSADEARASFDNDAMSRYDKSMSEADTDKDQQLTEREFMAANERHGANASGQQAATTSTKMDDDKTSAKVTGQQAAGAAATMDDDKAAMPKSTDKANMAKADDEPGTAFQNDVDFARIHADELIGEDVVNLAGEDVGEIEDLVINPQDNTVYAVISVGGFLGIGDKDVAVPMSELRLTDDEVILMSRQSEDSLKDSPKYEDNWQRIKD